MAFLMNKCINLRVSNIMPQKHIDWKTIKKDWRLIHDGCEKLGFLMSCIVSILYLKNEKSGVKPGSSSSKNSKNLFGDF